MVFASVLPPNKAIRTPKITGAIEKTVVIYRKPLFLFIALLLVNWQFAPNTIDLAGMLFQSEAYRPRSPLLDLTGTLLLT
jgi:hypothetical protein